jgi:hypothetical protein
MSLGGSFMPLGAQLYTLGLFYAPWGSSVRPPSSVRGPPYVCAPWAILSSLRLIYVPWGLNYAPWGSNAYPLSSVRPLYVCTPPLCVRALDSFKPLKAHICPLGAQLCSLGSSARLSRHSCPFFEECTSPPRRTCLPARRACPSHQAYAPPP